MLNPVTLLLLAGALCIGRPRATRRFATSGSARIPGGVVLGGVFVGSLAFFYFGKLTVALAAIIAAGSAGWFIRDVLAARNRRAGHQAVASFLTIVTADLRAGANLAGAFRRGTEALPPSTPKNISQPLLAAAALAHSGSGVYGALRTADAPLNSVGQLVRVGSTHGIALAGLFDQAAQRLEAQRRQAQAASASLQGPQATALVLTCLPLAGIGMGSAMGANPLGLLLGGGLGGGLLVIGTGLACGGFVWSRRIIAKAAPC